DACSSDAAALLESSTPAAVRTELAVFCSGKLLEGLDGVSPSFDRWLARERDRFKWKTRRLLKLQSHRAVSDDRDYVRPSSPPRTETYAHQPLPAPNRLRVALLPS